MFKGQGLIFVGGAPRSGTTLLQRILNAHPDIYGGPEFDLLPDIIRLKNSFERKIATGRIDTFLKSQDVPIIFGEFIKTVFFIKKEMEGVTYLSEKTPDNILVFNDLIDFLPEAKYIFVVRDPRAVVSSMLQIGKKSKLNTPSFTHDVVSAVRYINQCWESGCRALTKHPSTILVQYENLVLNRSSEITKLLKQLEIDKYELDLRNAEFEYSRNEESWKDWYTKEQLTSDIYTVSLEAWKHFLKPYQINYIECMLSNNAAREIYLKEKKGSRSANVRAKSEQFIHLFKALPPFLVKQIGKLKTQIAEK